MSQEEISKLLRDRYPDFVDFREIVEHLGITRRSVYSNLKKLMRRNEVEFIMVVDKRLNVFIRKYREIKD